MTLPTVTFLTTFLEWSCISLIAQWHHEHEQNATVLPFK